MRLEANAWVNWRGSWLVMCLLCTALCGRAWSQGAAPTRVASAADGGAADTPGALPPDNVWNLETAVARAMAANTELAAAKYEFERQEGVRLQLRARLVPNV